MSILATTATVSIPLVIGMGMGIVFAGLICLIIICYLMGKIVKIFENNSAPTEASAPAAPVAAAPAAAAAPIENRQELVAVIACAIAEELGTDVNAIRIKSIKKI